MTDAIDRASLREREPVIMSLLADARADLEVVETDAERERLTDLIFDLEYEHREIEAILSDVITIKE